MSSVKSLMLRNKKTNSTKWVTEKHDGLYFKGYRIFNNEQEAAEYGWHVDYVKVTFPVSAMRGGIQ
jgi:hypothetical protein